MNWWLSPQTTNTGETSSSMAPNSVLIAGKTGNEQFSKNGESNYNVHNLTHTIVATFCLPWFGECSDRAWNKLAVHLRQSKTSFLIDMQTSPYWSKKAFSVAQDWLLSVDEKYVKYFSKYTGSRSMLHFLTQQSSIFVHRESCSNSLRIGTMNCTDCTGLATSSALRTTLTNCLNRKGQPYTLTSESSNGCFSMTHCTWRKKLASRKGSEDSWFWCRNVSTVREKNSPIVKFSIPWVGLALLTINSSMPSQCLWSLRPCIQI